MRGWVGRSGDGEQWEGAFCGSWVKITSGKKKKKERTTEKEQAATRPEFTSGKSKRLHLQQRTEREVGEQS